MNRLKKCRGGAPSRASRKTRLHDARLRQAGLLDASGMYSRPGTTTFLIGEHLTGKWSEYRIH